MAAGEKVIPEITVGNQTYKLMDETAREHLVEVKSTTPTSEDNRLWIKEMSAAEEEANTYEVPTIDEFNDLKSALNTSIIVAEEDKRAFFETGKQLFDYTKANVHGFYETNGSFTRRNDMTGGYCIVKGLSKITFYSTNSERTWAAFLTAGNQFISAHHAVASGTTINVPDNAYYFFMSGANANIDKFVLTGGEIAWTKTQYKSFVNIENIASREILSKSIGKGLNLFNKNNVIPNHLYNYLSGVLQSSGDGYNASEFIQCKESTTYGFYVAAGSHVCYFDKHRDFISGAIAGTGFSTKTTPAGCAFITLSVQDIQTAMLTEGSTQQEYEPYYEYLKYGETSPGTFTTAYIYRQFNVPATSALTSATKTNTAYLKLPSTYSPVGEKTKLCILVHGASKGISSDGSTGWTQDTEYNKIVTALNNAGFAVMDSNGYDDSQSSGHEHWGCPQALDGYIQAYDYFTEHYNLDKDVYIYGFSMGGLTALNLMTQRPFPIKCGMIGAPVISLYDQCISGTAQSVNYDFLAAYGISSYDRTKLFGCDRYHDIVTVGSTPMIFNNLPALFIGYGSSDTAISNAKIQEYYTALYNSNHMVRIKEYAGGHSISYGGSDELIADIIKWFGYFD